MKSLKFITTGICLLLSALMVEAQDNGANLHSEPQYECIYSYIINSDVQETYSAVLQIGKEFTRFTDYTAYAVDSLSFSTSASDEEKAKFEEAKRLSMYYFDQEIWQNFSQGEMTVSMEVSPNIMEYKEELGLMNWTLEEGCETICGYQCNKATASYGGREWVVWYAPQIPSTAGPWKFNGLPGLILAASDSESKHKFEAIAFRSGTVPVVKAANAAAFQSSREKVLKAKLTSENDIKEGKMPGITEVKSVQIYKTSAGTNIVYINGVARRPRPNGYQPIELE